MRRFFILTLFATLVSMAGSVFGQVVGANMANPIVIPSLASGHYASTKNNSTANGFANDIGQPSDDIYYKFSLPVARAVTFSTCASAFDTYIHILDVNGTEIGSNDDNGPSCTGTRASLTITLNPGTYYYVAEGYNTNSGDIISDISCTAFSGPVGSVFGSPIVAGTISPGQTYTDTKSNDPVNGYGNEFGQASDDIYYQFTLASAGQVNISHCGSGFDTYMTLLDASGTIITSNDDNGPLCTGLTASIQTQLNAGTYYVVAEGFSSNYGNITTAISVTASGPVVNTDFASKMGQVLGSLETLRIPFGLLRDIALEQTNIENYNGVLVADSNYVQMADFRQIYQTLVSAKMNSSAGNFATSTVLDSLGMIARQPGKVVLSGLYYQYSKFTDDAVQSNRVSIVNNVVYDKYVSGTWQNPYETKAAFAIAPASTTFQGKTQQFLLPSNLWLGNSMSSVSSVQLDAGDGLGYRAMTVGTGLNVTYADTGRKELKFKIMLTNSTSLLAHSFIFIKPTVLEAFPNSLTYPITTTETFNGVAAQGFMTVKLANPSLGLRNPLIVVEGFDPGNITEPDKTYGSNNMTDFLADVNNDYGSNLKNILIDIPQYDIVYVDYKKGTDDIKRNALLFKQVIRQVNSMKAQAGSTAQNIVMGISMGGLVARWGLKDMENHTEDHQTKLFISYDSPQQGANVPLGYQFMVNHIRSLYLRTAVAPVAETYSFFSGSASLNSILTLASTPAARQMLINYVNPNNQIDNSVHTAWQTDLKNMGYPAGFSGKPLRNVAVSDGAECATSQVAAPDTYLLNFTGRASTKFLGDLAGQVVFPIAGITLGQPTFLLGVIPGKNTINADVKVKTVANGGGNQVYYNHITYTKKILWLINVTVDVTNESRNAPSGALPYDSYAGGYFDTRWNPSNSADANLIGKYSISITHQSKFGFVPTASALDIGLGNTALTDADYKVKYVGSSPPAAPKNSPFANFTTVVSGPSDNLVHTLIDLKTANWVAAEMGATNPQQANCTILCTGATITGPTQVCTTGSYSVAIPAGTTVQWSITGPATLSSTTANPVTITKTGNGNATLNAHIVTSCGAFDTAPLGILFGAPPITGTDYTDRTLQANHYQYFSSTITPVAGATAPSYVWYTEVNGAPSQQITTGTSINNYPIPPATTLFFQCIFTNACGSSVYRTYAYNTNGPASFARTFTVYPNPSTTELKVMQQATANNTDGSASSLRNNASAASNAKDNAFIPYNVILYDAKGRVVSQGSSTGKQEIKLRTDLVPNGIYYIHIKEGDHLTRQQVIIKH